MAVKQPDYFAEKAGLKDVRYPCMLLSMKYSDRITMEPGKCGGRPCIRGYRLRVKDVLELLASGASEKEILEDYDFLESEDIRACLLYAAAQANHTILQAA